MQENFSEWSIYISFIAYDENLLFFKKKHLILMLEISNLLFRHMMTDKMVASIEHYCEMYKKSYLPKQLNGFT